MMNAANSPHPCNHSLYRHAIGQQLSFAKSVALQLQMRSDCHRVAIVVARVPMQRASLLARHDRHGTLPQQTLEKT
jgi:hypothetical protein